MIDITNIKSFRLIQKLISNKIILIKNKSDQESMRQISNFEIKEYLDNYKSIDGIDISTKDGENIQELINKINKSVNKSKNDLPINLVSESQTKVKPLLNAAVGSLSLILIGGLRCW